MTCAWTLHSAALLTYLSNWEAHGGLASSLSLLKAGAVGSFDENCTETELFKLERIFAFIFSEKISAHIMIVPVSRVLNSGVIG